MYLSAEAIIRAIGVLRAHVHPFVGITFVACKHFGLSVGSMDNLSLDSLTRDHLDSHHLIDRTSSQYFQPFRGGHRFWVTKKYPSSGLQTINTQTFANVFLHNRKEKKWGFRTNYLEQIQKTLRQQDYATELPVDALAVWLYKGKDLGDIKDIDGLLELFFQDFQIAPSEKASLLSMRMLSLGLGESIFVSEPLAMTKVARAFPEPPDKPAEGGSTIASISLFNAGPGRQMTLDFGERLSLITGDNGLGKSFLLDFAWWAATGFWADREATPRLEQNARSPSVQFALRGGQSDRLLSFTANFDPKRYSWIRPRSATTVEALAVFSRADGSFAVSDPLRRQVIHGNQNSGSLSSYEVWNGRPGVIEGLIRDWTKWQSNADRLSFDRFKEVLRRLSPDDLGILTPDDPIRLPGDPRQIPTIRHRYGVVPVTQASSGVQRVLLLAYLIIWSWQEHELAAAQLLATPLRRMLVVVDELEAHLHPKWQRIVLPALMSVGDLLSSELSLQMVAATHSPMILASMETNFNSETDVLYHLYGDGPEVKLESTPFVKYGDASGWLTSPLFGLRHARSREAERAIEDAKKLQSEDEASPDAVAEVSIRLKQHLANDDKFWPRWLYFAERYGVYL